MNYAARLVGKEKKYIQQGTQEKRRRVGARFDIVRILPFWLLNYNKLDECLAFLARGSDPTCHVRCVART